MIISTTQPSGVRCARIRACLDKSICHSCKEPFRFIEHPVEFKAFLNTDCIYLLFAGGIPFAEDKRVNACKEYKQEKEFFHGCAQLLR